ncbi:MAG: alpha/beta fold hydrolase [Proteobacteria bacterium]|nr:alpha/beta fold hydrolase [Pseudomonadota bacterium]
MSGSKVMAQAYELVDFGTEDGGKIEASFFSAGNRKVVIFAHGAIFNKESWYFLAEEFQRKGVSALPIDFRGYGNSTPGSTTKKMYDILGAISYLRGRGFTDINVVGASMGGAAVLLALSNNSIPIHKVVVLAPAGGPAISSTASDKLFVISENERMFSGVMAIYDESAEPKQIQIYPGKTHAQHLFKTDVRDDLIERIINFINPE